MAKGSSGRGGERGGGRKKRAADVPDDSQSRPDRPPLDTICQWLIEVVRSRCPGLLPAEPLAAGTPTRPIPVTPAEVGPLVATAARQAALAASGAPPPTDPDHLPETVLWQDGPDALLVEVSRIGVEVAAGLLSVSIPVRCDQIRGGRDVAIVDLVVGTPDRPTGLLAAVAEPRGPRIVVSRWGDSLTALAWQAVLDSLGGLAAAAGVDRDGAVFVPTGLTANTNGIAVLAQARHPIDRVRPGQVVVSPRSSRLRP